MSAEVCEAEEGCGVGVPEQGRLEGPARVQVLLCHLRGIWVVFCICALINFESMLAIRPIHQVVWVICHGFSSVF